MIDSGPSVKLTGSGGSGHSSLGSGHLIRVHTSSDAVASDTTIEQIGVEKKPAPPPALPTETRAAAGWSRRIGPCRKLVNCLRDSTTDRPTIASRPIQTYVPSGVPGRSTFSWL